jgi:RNA polymerase sigma factor (TIGR02999 family)
MTDDLVRTRDHTTRLLRATMQGEAAAPEELLPIVYDELREIAVRLLAGRGRRSTLQPTDVIHAAWLRLTDPDAAGLRQVDGRVHFQRLAARAMRFVLVDHARAKSAEKRGGPRRRVTLDENLEGIADQAVDVLFVHEGLDRLRAVDAQLADIVEMRFFGGMTIAEIAQVLGVSTSSVNRGWRLARAWWLEEFADGDGERR